MVWLQALINPAWLLGMYEIPLDGLKGNNKDYTLVLMLFQSWALVSAQSVVYSIHSVLARSRTGNCGPRQLLLGTYKERLIRCSLVAVGHRQCHAMLRRPPRR